MGESYLVSLTYRRSRCLELHSCSSAVLRDWVVWPCAAAVTR